MRTALGYTWLCGPFYLLVAILGLIGGDHVLHLMAVDTFGNWVHAVEGTILLAIGAVIAFETRQRAVA
ncbi:DUF4383 domain-containing protein [Nocardia arthritidis]|uniref:DUF4383 domain-containing protein n=1 Tax=Nocardia arthritidis TaxID=228602 RepID=A0A6G9YP36_9NOCA|nr:DUF4383 domain-containing protein [Nocardia arthritidis]QIS14951.1 DUF4383 domain-containing protein [Nocardia arthritidis]